MKPSLPEAPEVVSVGEDDISVTAVGGEVDGAPVGDDVEVGSVGEKGISVATAGAEDDGGSLVGGDDVTPFLALMLSKKTVSRRIITRGTSKFTPTKYPGPDPPPGSCR